MARTTCPTDSLYTYGGNQGEQMCGYTTIHVESIGVKSFTKAYKIYDLSQPTTPKYAFNVLTAVISVNKGVVNSITWDDGCHFCSTISNVADGSNDFCVPNILVTNETKVDSAATVSLAQEYAQEGALPLSEQRLTDLKFDGYGKNCAMYGDKSSGAAGDCTTDDGAVCDLKLYIVWTGTDKNGQYFQSAGLRFSRFKMFSVSTLYSSARSLSLDAYSGAESTANTVADSVSSRL